MRLAGALLSQIAAIRLSRGEHAFSSSGPEAHLCHSMQPSQSSRHGRDILRHLGRLEAALYASMAPGPVKRNSSRQLVTLLPSFCETRIWQHGNMGAMQESRFGLGRAYVHPEVQMRCTSRCTCSRSLQASCGQQLQQHMPADSLHLPHDPITSLNIQSTIKTPFKHVVV